MGRGRARVLASAGLIVTVLGGAVPILLPAAAPSATASNDNRLAAMASPSPFRGLDYTGLGLGKDGSACEGEFEIKRPTGGTLGCTHGPDPAPPGVDVRWGKTDEELAADLAAGSAAGRASPTAGGRTAFGGEGVFGADGSSGIVACIGDGTSGARVQAIYAVAADRTDRSATVVPAIRETYAPRIDWQFNQSAAETGGEAHVVFVTEPAAGGGAGCQLSVAVARLSATGDDSFSNMLVELEALGFDRPDRKYLVWADSNRYCGLGEMRLDTRPGQNNRNNSSVPMYARIDSACWGYAEGHELMHTLGGVQWGSPHATAGGHCVDEPDDMCYDDDGDGPVAMITKCAGRNPALFDCNHDDYFYAGEPPLVNWLATHWNTYDSRWLHRGPLPTDTAPPPVSPDPTTTTTTAPPPTTSPPEPPPRPTGYWMLTAAGQVRPFGRAARHGEPSLAGGARAVDLEPTPSGNGYWTLDTSGRVSAFGDAGRYGSVTISRPREEWAVSLSATPTGKGYWVFTSRGRAVPYGDAGFFGDMSAVPLNRPVIGSVATPTGKGYYLFAADGGTFTFGDAAFFGSTGSLRLNRPVVAMAVAPGKGGYWLVGSDGGLFAFGAAGFYGSMGAVRLNRPVSAVVPGQAGYLMVGEDGGAFSFGDVEFFGSLGANPPPSPVVSVALRLD